MSSQDRLENVLRDIHVMISKSETYDTDRIIVSKQDIFNLIDRLNASIYEIMDEYELTQQSRDRALREHKKEGDKIIWDASRQAEDIYAASVLYTEEALNHLNVMVEEADATIGKLYKNFQNNMKQQQETIRENHLELKSQLQLLADTEKYLKLIEERNREIERERAGKAGRKKLEKFGEKHTVIKPEIKINEEYFRKAGIPIEKDDDKKKEDEIDYMEPLPDEGVIESTLKKAEEEIRRTVLEEKAADAENGSAGFMEDMEDIEDLGEQTAGTGAGRDSFSDTDQNQHAAAMSGESADAKPTAAAGSSAADDYSDLEKYAEENTGRSGMTAAQSETSDTALKEEKMTGASAAAVYEGTASAEKDRTDTAAAGEDINGTEASKELSGFAMSQIGPDGVLDESLSDSLDAEYFKWKNNEKDEESQQPRREKISLLDKLMGKKKSF